MKRITEDFIILSMKIKSAFEFEFFSFKKLEFIMKILLT
jgi:hypothetical protein